ncbi:MAG: (d)CMP kinase [Candidatus Marinimicrobia bacterium]|nr:(d)CMP kinase [Candidatus Neomarinimicrobiota bacterium]MDP6820849.1 (d)CMP kinase [Candidatus Neomarinimicrobiota bacterium]
MIIAIDGPAASGKSTTAQGVAQRLGIMYLNTGAMYRAMTLGIVESGLDLEDIDAVQGFIADTVIGFGENNQILLNGKNVSAKGHSSAISDKVSAVSAVPDIRKAMVQVQREIASKNDCVLEGRDIGTVVFPEAKFKFFLVADVAVRAARRMKDLEALGESWSLDELIKDILRRDELDSTRSHSPLVRADDAIPIDTSHLTIDETIEKIVNKITKIKNEETS